MRFYKIIYGQAIDDTVIEQTLLARKGEIVMTPEYRESYLEKLHASGLDQQKTHEQISGIIEPISEKDQSIVINCLGLSDWRVPTLSESAETLNASKEELEDALERLSAAIAHTE